jgi:hypothetical protein
VHQPDAMPPDIISKHATGPPQQRRRPERVYRQLDDRDVRITQFGVAEPLGIKATDVRLESASVKSDRDFGDVPFDTAHAEFPYHQQNRPRSRRSAHERWIRTAEFRAGLSSRGADGNRRSHILGEIRTRTRVTLSRLKC